MSDTGTELRVSRHCFWWFKSHQEGTGSAAFWRFEPILHDSRIGARDFNHIATWFQSVKTRLWLFFPCRLHLPLFSEWPSPCCGIRVAVSRAPAAKAIG